MRGKLVQTFTAFLESHWDRSSPVLLGLSGGSDSLALLHLLLQHKTNYNLSFGVAHVDHGWRPESGQEASQLKILAKKLGLPFHHTTLCPEKLSGNLEAACRQERLNFFSAICQEHNYQAVLLGHHQDDQAETVLKNLFEGTNLSSCTGMLPVTQMDRLTIWRPLLETPKKELLDWVRCCQATPFVDATNFDMKYLRARMRGEIIPELCKMFGKNINATLSRLGKESCELQQFLGKHLTSCLQAIESTASGSFLDFMQFPNVDTSLEVRFMIRKIAEGEGCYPSREILEKAASHIILRSANRRFTMGTHHFFVDRGAFFVSSLPFSPHKKERASIVGSFQYGDWLVSVEDHDHGPGKTVSNWKSVWNGSVEVVLPALEGNYEIGSPVMNSSYPRTSSISKWWSNHKIPAFLRASIPVIWAGDVVAHEFLTGRTKPHPPAEKRWQKIRLLQIR